MQADSSTQSATAWSLLGSNNGSSWTLFSSDNGQGATLATYTFSASGTYSYYRLVLTKAASGSNNQNARVIRFYVNGTYPVDYELHINNIDLYKVNYNTRTWNDSSAVTLINAGNLTTNHKSSARHQKYTKRKSVPKDCPYSRAYEAKKIHF